jgi:hypothetical protein
VKNAFSRGIFTPTGIASLIRITFISGPWMLLTSPLSGKNASLMILLCAPALLFCSLLVIPPLLFPSPQQNAYYYFAQGLNQDPLRWVVLGVAMFFAMLALAIPATAGHPRTVVRR